MIATVLRALRAPLTTLAVVIAIGTGVLFYIDFTLENAHRNLARQQGLLRDARTRLQKVGDERATIIRYLGSYQHLQQLGFIGDEQRVNWLSGLRVANRETQLYGVDYQISAQQPYPYANELNPGQQLALYQSVMKINFNLLHEGDMMRFLGALAKQGVGVFSVNQCSMERIDNPPGGNQPNLRADCELAWITLRPSTAEDRKS